MAFAAARSADPNAKLYINDYSLDSANAKVNGLVKLVNSINQSVPSSSPLINGCGTETHLSVRGLFTNAFESLNVDEPVSLG